MPENATTTAGPSLEQILWRAMDRWEERPALVDSEEFASHIAAAFDGDLPSEHWVARFFDGADKMHQVPADMAEAIVRATRDRLHVFEFDLKRLEYVIVEDKEKVVVVSDFGQFALQNDDTVSRAIEAAVIPAAKTGTDKTPERGGNQPKAYFVRASGEVVAVDVNKVARSLERLMVRQVSMPAVSKPGARLAPFAPARRSLTEAREARALRQDARTRQALPAAPRLDRTRKGDTAASAAPAGAQTALFLLMPDGTLARPEMGSATRWQQMVSNNVRSAAAPVPVVFGQRITVQAGNVVAIINHGTSGTVGERAEARAGGIASVRADAAPIRVLGDDELAKALAAGAMVVPGLARSDKFWIQPDAAFKPDEKSYSQLGSATGAVVAEPLKLGEITGDPWGDWALTGGGEMSPDLMMALRGRTTSALRKALGDSSGEMVPPELAQKLRGVRGKDLQLPGTPVVGFRAPDGSIIAQKLAGNIRLAAMGRDGSLPPLDLQLPGMAAPVASRSGAIPATALSALQMALEQTANAGGYRLPMMRIESARNALDAGELMELSASDPRRTSVRLAGSSTLVDNGSGQVAQLVLSMPFPNNGELHVGSDLSEALQAYLGAAVQPASGSNPFGSMAVGGAMGAGAAGGMVLRLRGGQLGADGMPLDWSGLHAQAIQRAQDAVVTLDLPMVQQQLADSPSFSGLPVLLQRALAESGDWTPGPGMAVPIGIRQFAMQGPFDLAAGLGDMGASLPPPTRPLNPGEEEIVIPMPLWAQMGRGVLSDTDQIMASPLAPAGYAPPMGVYRLVVPVGGPVDMTGGAPAGTPGVLDLVGPTGLEVLLKPNQSTVLASSLGGKQLLGRVAVDDGETVVSRRGRIRIGQPISSSSSPGSSTPDSGSPGSSSWGSSTPGSGSAPSSWGSSDSALSQGGSGSPASSSLSSGDSAFAQGGSGSPPSPTVVSGASPSVPRVDVPSSGTYIDGSFSGGASAAGNTAGGAQMTGALRSAVQMSNDVAARTSMPGRPAIGNPPTSSPSIVTDSSGFSARAQAAGKASAGSSGISSSPSGSNAVVAGSSTASTPGVTPSGQYDSSGGSNQTLVATAASGTTLGVQAGSAIADMTSSSASVRRAADSAGSSSSTPSFITGLQPGMWSGHRRDQTLGYQNWSYSSSYEDRPRSAGGVDLASLAKPVYPSLPTALRFRYVGAPLWWSGPSRNGVLAGRDFGYDEDESSSPATRAMRAGLRAATSAASIWRSILVASPEWGGKDDLSGGMDAGHDQNAGEMSSLARGFDALTAGSLVGAGAAAGATAGYVGVSSSGAAGTLTRGQAGKARADSVEMQIVAAIPPAPPPLETMSSATAGDVPHARAKGHGKGAAAEHKEDAGAVSHSKIEGSVDAIAQRIYHRIRRRIQSDRERFGG